MTVASVTSVRVPGRGPLGQPGSLAALRALVDAAGVWILVDLHLRIHRDDLYGPQSARTGKADLVTARNRYGPGSATPSGLPGAVHALRGLLTFR